MSIAWLAPNGARADLPTTCPVEVGRWAHGPSLAVSADDTIAIVGSGAVLQTVDISSPTAPVVLGEITMPDVVWGAELDGRYAYVAAGTADLRVIDLVDPAHPVEVGSAPYGTQSGHLATDVVLHGGVAFVLGYAGVTYYDISQPTSPTERGTYPYNGANAAWDLSINGEVFVVVFDDVMTSEIYFVDFSNPDSLQEIGTYRLETGPGVVYNPTALLWHGDFVYVTDYQNALWVVDASNPSAPADEWLVLSGGGGLTQMIVVDDTLVGAHRFGSIRFFDISDPARPEFTTWLDGTEASDLWQVPSSSYVLSSSRGGGFDVVDLSSPATPSIATRVEGIGAIEDLVVTGSTGFVASGFLYPRHTWPPSRPNEFISIGLSRPDSAEVLDSLEDSAPKTLKVFGNYAYVPTYPDFKVVDVSDPMNLTVVGSFAGSSTDDLSVAGDLGIYPYGSVAKALDLSVPTAPAVVGICEGGSGSAHQSELTGHYAHVTFGDSFFDLVTCDVSNPASPFATSTIDLWSNEPADLLVVRNHLIMTNESQVRTFDLSTPSVPSPDGSLSLAGNPDRMDSLANLLFVIDDSYNGSLMVINIGDLSSPELICTIPTIERPTAISQSGGLIYVGLTHSGFQVFGFPDLVFADDFERGDARHWD